MLNAHTATRTFRELQFDIKAFLTALYNIMPADGHEDEGLVEIKWADGSVDIVPTFALIRSICNSTYMKLLIGGVAELIPEGTTYSVQNGKYYRTTMKLIIQSAPLKVPVREIGSEEEDLEFIKGVIGELVANDVSLPYDADIATIKVDGSLTTSYCNVNDTATIGSLSCDSGSIQRYDDRTFQGATLDLSNVQLSVPIQVITPNRGTYDLSRWTQIGTNATIHPLYSVTGNFRFGGDDSDISDFRLNRDTAGMLVSIPIMKIKSQDGSVISSDWEYISTGLTPFPSNRLSPFPIDTLPSVTMLYPLKTTDNYANGRLLIKIVPPKEEDNGKIVNVQNPTGQAISVCNAWSFSKTPTSTGLYRTSNSIFGTVLGVGVSAITGRNLFNHDESNSSEGSVIALNTIQVPPYSAIDFLFSWSIKGNNNWEAYMFPMTSRNLNVGQMTDG